VVLGSVTDDGRTAVATVLDEFNDGPVVVGGLAPDVTGAGEVTTAALSGLRAIAGWPSAPRPVSADELLPERTLAGDAEAREQLIDTVYRPLADGGHVLLETVVAYLDSGRALEATARALFVHTNTVRYRLRRVAELCGRAPTDARGAFTIQLALTVGRLSGYAVDVNTGEV
jgi:DNA-binding PucR family transcriptional regulator